MCTSFSTPGPLALNELSVAVEALLEGFDDRGLRIIRDRILGLRPTTTLEEFGREFGLTRERVRQIEVGLREKLNRRLAFPKLACIKRAADSFATQIGLACPSRYIDELVTLTRATSCSSDLLPILLWQGGPYAPAENWLIRHPLHETRELLESLLPPIGTSESQIDVQTRLIEQGLDPQFCVEILNYFECRTFDNGMVVRWRGSLADKAFLLLANHAKPMTREEISSQIPEEHSIRTLGNYLFSDARFARVNLTDFALAAWGTPEYKGIVPEITQEIGRRGGEATLAELRGSLVSKFGVSDRSIVSYLNSPFFTRTLGGGFRVRREDETLAIQSKPELARSCFLVDRRWTYRLQVDSELIRGSGRNVSTAFAAGISLAPGEVKLYASPHGDFRISWLGSQPSVGSIRMAIEEYGLAVGDWLYLRPDADHITFYPLRLNQIEAAEREERLFIQCCPHCEVEESSRKPLIAKAIGLRESDGWTAIGRRFLERRENALHDLVPELHDEPNEESIDELFAFLGTEAV